MCGIQLYGHIYMKNMKRNKRRSFFKTFIDDIAEDIMNKYAKIKVKFTRYCLRPVLICVKA